MRTIGRYQLIEKLGQGGMGTVYQAFDPLIHRAVAVKVIAAHLDDAPEMRERFYAEARAAGRLSHRNIVTIHDLGEDEGQPYLAMEFLEGRTLDARMRSPEGMSLDRKLDVMIQLCGGLAYAHERNVIHRDIKPGNIFVTDAGVVKILDFGLARLPTSELTRSHAMLGTVNYMAPEQVRGERTDHRADIFSTAVVFYELLTGRKAFEAESFASTLHKILQEMPEPPQRFDPGIPPEVVAIVDRGLAKARDERYQHVGEMLRDLVVCRETLAALGHLTTPTPGPARAPTSDRYRAPGSGARTSAGGLTPRPATPPRGSNWPEGVPTPRPAGAGGGSGAGMDGASGPAAVHSNSPWWRRAWFAAAGILVVALLAVAGVWWRASQAEPSDVPSQAVAVTPAGPVVPSPPPGPAAPGTRPPPPAAAPESSPADDREATGTGGAQGRDPRTDPAARRSQAEPPAPTRETAARPQPAVEIGKQDADLALSQLASVKAAADAAQAAELAPQTYQAASVAQSEGQALYRKRRFVPAAAKLLEAHRLYHQAETDARAEDARRSQEQRERAAVQGRLTKAREGYERAHAGATEAGAARLSAGRLQYAEGRASEAAAHENRGDLAAAVTAYQEATTAAGEAQRSAEDAARRQATAPPSSPPAAQQPPAEDAVRQLLQRYAAALESRSLQALHRVWPSLEGIQERAIADEFQNARAIDVELGEPKIDVSGSNGTLTVRRRYAIHTTDGQRLQTDTVMTMTLRRRDGAWLIEQVRHAAAR